MAAWIQTAWLILNNRGKPVVTSTPNQDNPLMDVVSEQGLLLLGIDVWGHAYYLKYQTKPSGYLDVFWSIPDWKATEDKYKVALSNI